MYKNIFSKIFSKVFFFVFLFNLCFPIFVTPAFAQNSPENNTTNPGQFAPRGQPNSQSNISNDNSTASCWNFSLSDCLISILDIVGRYLFYIINWFLEGVLTLASLVLDFAIYSTIVEFKTNFADLKLNPNITGGTAGYTTFGTAILGGQSNMLIYYLWSMIRDFINIVIFIVIIYHAVQSMFTGFTETKNKFISLLVFSVVINFSLLFVQIAIDVSNILSLQAYTLAVKPTNTSTFYDFRTSSPEGVPKSYGEYIMNSVDMDKILNGEVGRVIAAAELEKMQNTFFFQLGKFAVFIGLIYIFLYMAGLLFYRAINFVFAMILAPLITLDVFFSYFGKSSSQMQEFAGEIRGKIGSIRGDFYEALIKGPLLIFFIYLVGVFAEAIFTQGAMAALTNSLNRMEDVRNSSGSFVSSLAVFFKFVVFIILANEVLRRINEIKFTGGSGRLSGWGTKFANYTFGRGLGGAARITGLGLQNTVGRLANNSDTLSKWSNNTLKWKNADPNTYSGMLKRAVGGSAFKSIDLLRNGSYDAGNLVGKINKTSGGTLAKGIKAATLGADIDFGKRVTDSISDRDKAALDARKKARDKNIEEAEKGDMVTKEMIDHVNHDEKNVKLGNSKITLDQFRSFVNDPSVFKATADANIFEHDGIKISLEDLEKMKNKDPEILLKIKEAEEKNMKIAEHHAAEAGEKRAKDISKEYLSGERGGVGTLGKIQDVAALRDRPFGKEGEVTKNLIIDTARVAQKSAKDKAKEDKKIVDFITGTFGTSVSSLDKDLSDIIKRQIDSVTKDGTLSNAEKISRTEALKKQQETLSKDLKEFMGSIPEYYTSKNEELKDKLENFDNEDKPASYKKVMDAKKKAHEYIIKAAAELGKSGGVDEKLGRIYKSIGRRSTSLNEMDELYKKAKPAEHGHDDHSKDKAKGSDKKEEKGGH